MKDANEPSRVATPMSIPRICQTAMPQDAAASPSVPVSAAAAAASVARATAAGSAGTPVPPAAGNAASCGSPFIIASLISPGVLGFVGEVAAAPGRPAGWS